MMQIRTLERLLAVAKTAGDERRADLARIENAVAEAVAAEAAQEARIAAEWEVVHADPLAARGFAEWLAAAKAERLRLAERRAALQRSEAAARKALRDAFAETKGLEVALAAARRAARKTAQRRAQNLAEEAEIARFARRTPF
jgi:hypothetical protein